MTRLGITPVELSVLVPCLDEEANLPELVDRLGKTFDHGRLNAEVVLVDDGSTDQTWSTMLELAAQSKVVVPVRHEQNRGIAEAWRTALEKSRGRIVCLFDADLQYQPEDILRLLRTLRETQCDVVQGWRSPVARLRQNRYYWSRGLSWILNRLFGLRLRDCKSGFVLCPREVLEDVMSVRRRYHYWQSFILVAAHAKGYSYREIETLFEARRAGQSFLANVPLRVILRVFWDLVPALLEYRFRSPRRDVTQTFLDRGLRKEGLASPALSRHPGKRFGRGLRWAAYRRTFDSTHWMMTKDAFRHLEELDSSQWLSRESLEELQAMKLRRLVRHAYRHVPFYRERMREAGVTPDDIQGVSDLALLPLLTKQDVRENLYFDIMSDNHDKRDVLRITTSGSTGEPFVCFVDRSQLEFRWAATIRAMMWTGWRPGDRQVRLWHQTIGMSRSQVLRERADAWFLRRSFIPAYEISDATLAAFVRAIERAHPTLMDGYAESFNVLARYVSEHGGLPVTPKGIISSAQQLPESTRQIIEEAFGCRVFDKYGSREFSGIAYECDAHTGHHVVGEGYIVEVLRGGKPCPPGEIGEVVITDINNACLPFIRYRIGDLTEVIDPAFRCPCGRGLPMIGSIQGRVQSVIVGADGQYVPGTFFAHLFKDFDHAIWQYQVVQEKRGSLTLRIVPAGRYSESAHEEIVSLLRRFLGARTQVNVEIVGSIPLVRTGKRLPAVSNVTFDLQQGDEKLRLADPR
jgi:phenylacetate-CoA ligase